MKNISNNWGGRSLGRKTLVHITTVPQTLSLFSGQLQYMKSKGFDIYLISSPGQKLIEVSKQEGVHYIEAKINRDINLLGDLKSLIKIIFILKRINPDIVHAHTPKAGLLSMISSWIHRTPVRIYHVHGLVYETAVGLKRKILKLTEFISCLLANQVFCVSKSVESKIIEEKLCNVSKTKVILNGTINGIDAEYNFAPTQWSNKFGKQIRQELNISENAFIIGFVGRLVKDKGIEDLVTAFSNIEFTGTHLMLIGPLDSRDSISDDTIKTIESNNYIHIIGYVNNLVPYYSAMDLLVHPSYREGFGQVILEASSMELPVIATNVTGCIDAVEDGVTGLIVQPRDTGDLKKAIEKYITDYNLRKIHGLNGRNRALNNFNPKTIWRLMWQEYKNLLLNKNM